MKTRTGLWDDVETVTGTKISWYGGTVTPTTTTKKGWQRGVVKGVLTVVVSNKGKRTTRDARTWTLEDTSTVTGTDPLFYFKPQS